MVVATALTAFTATTIKHPYAKALMCFVLAIVLVIPTFLDTRLSVVPCMVAIVFVVVGQCKYSVIPATVVVLLSLVFCLYPDANNQLYLQSRYVDKFTRLYEGAYYAEYLDETIAVSRKYGDTYYALMYEDYICNVVMGYFPIGTVFEDIEVDAVQSRRFFTGAENYCNTVKPTVRVRAQLPTGAAFEQSADIPFNLSVELTEKGV